MPENNNIGQLEDVLKLLPEGQAKTFLIELVNALPNIVTILNEERRLIYSNKALLEGREISDINLIFDMRPGEIFRCVNIEAGHDGCGSSEACQLCGAYNALIQSMDTGLTVSNECRILSNENQKTFAYNLKFTSIPFKAQDSKFYIVTIEDISADIRKKELERIFFHDVLNSLAGIQGVLRILQNELGADDLKAKILESAYTGLNDTIKEQRDFSLAEDGELEPKIETVNSLIIIQAVALQYHKHNAFEANVVVNESAEKFDLETDYILLFRVLTNMTKNGLEASSEGELVSLNAQKTTVGYVFSVHNPGYIPQSSQYQIFERSFTTKGSGRGLGTFSMKLLGENYLNGKVSFNSTKLEGTTFQIELPLH